MAHHFLQACPGKRHGVANMASMAHRASGGFFGTFNKGRCRKTVRTMDKYCTKLWKK